MLYNNNILYDQPQISFVGTIVINVIGIENPIILSNVSVSVSLYEDFSNATTVAVLSYDVVENGILVVEATQSQASALIEAAISSTSTQTAEVTLMTE